MRAIKSQLKCEVTEFKHKADAAHNQRAKLIGGLLSHPLPQPCTVTLQKNPAFVGRDDELCELYDWLLIHGNPSQPTSFVIEGCCGIGKTQIALEFLYRYHYAYEAIFWVRTGSPSDLRCTYGAIGRKLKLFNSDNIDRPKVEQVHEWLQTTGMFSETLRCRKECKLKVFQDLGGSLSLIMSSTGGIYPNTGHCLHRQHLQSSSLLKYL